jgi:hypothetical protein
MASPLNERRAVHLALPNKTMCCDAISRDFLVKFVSTPLCGAASVSLQRKDPGG